MAVKSADTQTDWLPFSRLRQIETDISEFGYCKEFIEKNRLYEKKEWHREHSMTGVVNFFEEMEVKEEGGEIFYREHEKHRYMIAPKSFETQLGVFQNHNNGEFMSWVEKRGGNGSSGEEALRFYMPGNFYDMLDCGPYTYAISNLMHMCAGELRIVKINKEFKSTVIFDTQPYLFPKNSLCLEYDGYVRNADGFIIIASGTLEMNYYQEEKRRVQDRTLLFQISADGICRMIQNWEFRISSPYSMAVLNEFVYFGHSKMVTRLNLKSEEIAYFTNKSDEEIAALRPIE